MEELTRKDGFIDLDELFKNPQCKVTEIDWENDEKNFDEYKCSKIRYIFSFNNEKWFYKEVTEPVFLYTELIAEEIAKCFSIPVAHYDLAKSNEYGEGVITRNFKITNANYISGEDILKEYIINVLKITDDSKLNDTIKKYNSLEGIWNALEYRYRNYLNKDEIVKMLMDKIANTFIYDMLTGNPDRHESNWGIIEENGNFSLQPLYDNERISYLDSDIKLLPYINSDLSTMMAYDEYIEKILLEFITLFENEYLELLKEKLPLISKENIEKVFSRVEERINSSIPSDVKEDMKECFLIITNVANKLIFEYENERKTR